MTPRSTPTHPATAGVRLHIVTGKGGTGKTTVAAALAIAIARQGKKVLLAEVEDRQGISQIFDIAPLAHAETLIFNDPSGGSLWGLAVEPKAALLEYLHKFYKLGRAGSLLEKLGAVDFATTIAPGLRDVLLIGKVYEAVGRRTGRGRSAAPVYDAVVLDAPPTGRIGRFLGVNEEVAEIAKVGPIRGQADSITALLQSRITAVHVVTLLEEMPVQECIDALAELTVKRMPLGGIVVNQVRDPILSDADLDDLAGGASPQLRAAIADDLAHAGVAQPKTTADTLLAEAAEHLERLDLQGEQDQRIQAQGRAVFYLTALADGLQSGGITVLADELHAQGMV
ncbi:MAG TPA: ArsA-related P-loop ATPase [Tetrasphaera sp.]|uniref:ArsA-related P-loop ATPase n=1 Tax=Nostocoides sp. TaxID=1917966 RepID=UPI002C2B3787|nr:ArsA-related P-loop ATPase [Tetrasphaera sp.]HNQ07266.1 ArsA-related P-loop ATPase [Tetrasphaera sp.]